MNECPHCDRHDDPRRRPWAVYLDPRTGNEDRPTVLFVTRTDGSHVAESDAAWLRKLISEHRSTSDLPSATELDT